VTCLPPLFIAVVAGSTALSLTLLSYALIRRARVRLDRNSRLLADHARHVAHDFRIPLSNLRCQTEVALLRRRSAEEYEQLLINNLQEYESLSRMIDNVLVLGQIENGGVTPHYARIDLDEELQYVVRQCMHLATAGRSSIRVRAKGHLCVDPVLFRRAIGNLLANALHHVPAGAQVDVTATWTTRAVYISVSNPGPEIAAEHLERIFDRFYRIEQTGTRPRESTGLGLAIVRSIMALHDGNVCVESGDGVTRFTLLFPNPPTRTVPVESTVRSAAR
jgi:two-component system heavy metal sensor histidine kinase CusS